MFIMFITCMHMCAQLCACVHAMYTCTCVWGLPPPIPTHLPTHVPRGIPKINKKSISLEQIEIFQFCLKIYDLWRHPHLWVGCMSGWVSQWVESGQITKNLINLDPIKIIQFWTFWSFLLKPLKPFTGLFFNLIH